MKKIGIITFHNAYNYGAFLQTFALYEHLKKNFDCYIIDYECQSIVNDYRLIKFNSFKNFLKSIIYFRKNLLRRMSFDRVINESLLFKKTDDEYDIAIAGSDQIWNIKLTNGYDPYYSLEKIKANKKISYASSVGEENLITENKEHYMKIVDNIDVISVRENSAKEKFNSISNKEIFVNLDPTMLLTKDDWEKYVPNMKFDCNYIFSYFVGVTQSNYDALRKVSEKLSLPTISYSRNKKEHNVITDCYTDDPFTFISRIKNSKFVFTSSFHGTVFSIIFNKPFICMIPKKRANRIIDLLTSLGLEDRMINDISELDKFDYDKKIDYVSVNKKLEQLRQKSIDWLNKNM